LLESKLLWRPEIKESWLRQTGDILPQCLYVRWPQEAVMDRVVSKIDLLWPLSSNRSGAVIGWVGGGWWSHPHLGTASPMPEDHCGGRILNKCLVECMVSTSQLCWGFTGYNWEFWAQVWKITGFPQTLLPHRMSNCWAGSESTKTSRGKFMTPSALPIPFNSEVSALFSHPTSVTQ
jgi:hypothetical protein